MVKLTVLYGQPDDPQAFDEYYESTHVPLVEKIPDLQRFEAAKVVATPDGGAPPHYMVAELWFEDADGLQNALGSPEGQDAAGDLPNFATGGATLLICDVHTTR